MSAISGAAMRCRTMADGSLRIEVEIEPKDAQAAFALFGKPGAPMALAALVEGYAAHREPEKPKGGAAARWLGIKCADPLFREWLRRSCDIREELSDDAAAKVVRDICIVQSRADIDNDVDAFARFDTLIRKPYMEHLGA